MKTPIKLIASDLDGTFLNSDRRIPPEHFRAVELAREAGVIFCLASGRAINTIYPFAAELGGGLPIVSANGAFVIDDVATVILDKKLPDGAPHLILDYAEARNLHINVYLRDQIYASRHGWEYDVYSSRARTNEIVVKDMDFLRSLSPTKILFVDEASNMPEHETVLTEKLQPFGVPVVRSEAEYIEFLPAGINKGLGLAALAAHLSINATEVAAIGDWLNDYEMLEWAGVSGAVGNAEPTLKAIADKVYGTNNEGGVLQFVEEVLHLV